MSKLRDTVMVVALEFGIPHSTIGYSCEAEFNMNPLKVLLDTSQHLSGHIPTYILLDDDKRFVAFGPQAKELYDNLAESDATGHYYMYYFDFHNSPPKEENMRTRHSMLEDINGTKLPMIDVYAHGLRYLKTYFLNKYYTAELEDTIHWVLIGPSNMGDPEGIMLEAASKAGIEIARCSVIRRSEAITFGFKYLQYEGNPVQTRKRYSWKRCMIIDAKDDEVAVTVMEIQHNGKLKQVINLKDDSCSYKEIILWFESILGDLVGPSCLKEYKIEHQEDYNEMIRDFKRSLRNASKPKTYCRWKCPLSLLEWIQERTAESRKDSQDGAVIAVKRDLLQVHLEVIENFILKTMDNLAQFVKYCLNLNEAKGIHTLFLIGSLSEIPIVQHKVREDFHDKCVVTYWDDQSIIQIIGGVVSGHENGFFPGFKTYADIDFVQL